jgi:glycosyltransferase involved in cell wall biosynthesis
VTRVFLVDPSARDFRGHFRKQLAAFAAMLAPNDRYAIVNRGWSGGTTIGGAHVVPWFRWALTDLARATPKELATRSRDATRRRLRTLGVASEFADPLAYCAKRLVWSGASLGAKASAFWQPWRLAPKPALVHRSIYRPELRRMIQAFRLGAGDHVVMPTTDQQILLAVLSICTSIAADKLPRFHLRFLCDDTCNISGHPSPFSFEDMLRWIRAEGLLNRRIFLYAETARLADWLESVAGVRPALAPYPVGTGPRLARATRRRSLRIGYLGQARSEKGFDRLAAILRQFEALHVQVGAKRRDVPAISAIVHAAGSEKMVRIFEQAAQGLGIELELIDRTLDEDEYQQILERIDVLVLPYDIDRYARKGSGIVQEALAHAIPFVCSAQTGLVDFLTEKNGESARTDAEFASSLLKIVLNYDRYLDRAIAAASKQYPVLEANPLRDNICAPDVGHGRGGSEPPDAVDAAAASCSGGWASIASYVSRTAGARRRGPTASA